MKCNQDLWHFFVFLCCAKFDLQLLAEPHVSHTQNCFDFSSYSFGNAFRRLVSVVLSVVLTSPFSIGILVNKLTDEFAL